MVFFKSLSKAKNISLQRLASAAILIIILLFAHLALAKDPGDVNALIKTKFDSACASWKRGDKDEAMKLFEHILEMDPKHSLAYQWITYIYGEEENYKRADETLLKGPLTTITLYHSTIGYSK